jgi:hypothetical protein
LATPRFIATDNFRRGLLSPFARVDKGAYHARFVLLRTGQNYLRGKASVRFHWADDPESLVFLPDCVNSASMQSAGAFKMSSLCSPISNLELPALEAHHHSAEFVPGDFLAMNDKKLRAAIGSLNQSDLVRVTNSPPTPVSTTTRRP